MKTQKLSIRKFLIISCLMAVLAAGVVQAADDALLEMLPEDALFCVRINDLNATLGKMDAYLTGASPVPVSLAMLVNMQMAGAVGDPMMTGINMNGTFAAVGLGDMTVGFLVPVSDFAEFVKNNPNCNEGEDGIAILSAEGAMISFAMVSAGKGYAIVVAEPEKARLGALKTALSANGSLAERISVTQMQEAVTAPVWAYINTAALYNQFSPMVLSQLDMAQQNMPMGSMGEAVGLYFKMYAELFKTFAGDADSVTIALTPDAASLSLDLSLKAKDGSETAQMLVSNPTADEKYTFTGYLNNDMAVNGLMKMDQVSMQKMYDKFFDILGTLDKEQDNSDTVAKMKAITRKSLAAMGGEAAFSFSYSGAMPPFTVTEVVAVKDMSAVAEIMKDSMNMAGDFYAEIGIPMTFDYQAGTSSYKGATIDTISIDITSMMASDDPNNPMGEAMKQLYGDALTYIFAHDKDKYYVAMGGDAETEVKKLIDKDASAPATGEVKAAIDLLQKGGYNDFACSINIIKLLSGLGDMMKNMEGLQPSDCPNQIPTELFSGLGSIPSQSSLAMGGKISDGQISTRIVLPKQHLMEVMAAVMQIQQKTMQQMQGEMRQ